MEREIIKGLSNAPAKHQIIPRLLLGISLGGCCTVSLISALTICSLSIAAVIPIVVGVVAASFACGCFMDNDAVKSLIPTVLMTGVVVVLKSLNIAIFTKAALGFSCAFFGIFLVSTAALGILAITIAALYLEKYA